MRFQNVNMQLHIFSQSDLKNKEKKIEIKVFRCCQQFNNLLGESLRDIAPHAGCLTCRFRARCYSERLSWAQVLVLGLSLSRSKQDDEC